MVKEILMSLCSLTLLLSVLAKPNDLMQGCPVCEPHFCPLNVDDCPKGLTKDLCGCCELGLCQLGEGERCLDPSHIKTISDTDLGWYGSCGDRMVCDQRMDIDPDASKESVCFCKDKTVVCGSDNVTYSNTCALSNAENSPRIVHEGPCLSAPIISTGPEDIIENEDGSIALDCEASGFPVPTIKWEFLSTTGMMIVLPGDDTAVVVQTRGGPEAAMVTSWVQIVSARKIDSGTYFCVASNEHGTARAAAVVRIHV